MYFYIALFMVFNRMKAVAQADRPGIIKQNEGNEPKFLADARNASR